MAKEKKTYDFRGLSDLSSWTVRWLYFNLAVSVLYVLGQLLVIRDTAGLDPTLSSDTALPSDLIVGLTSLVQLVSLVITGVVVLKWIYRADANIQRRSPDVSVTPLWAVLFYFVPILSLWKPFRAMREIWQASHDPVNWRTVPVPGLLRWWWGLYLSSNFLQQASLRATIRGDIEGARISAYIDVVELAIYLPLTLVLVAIVRRVNAAQADWRRDSAEAATP